MVHTLEVIATRNVTLRDIAAAARAFGKPLLHYDGRINLSDDGACGIRNDVTFSLCGDRGRGVDFSLDPDTGGFAAPPDTVVFDLGGCNELDDMRITAVIRTPSPLPAEQLDALLGAIAVAFDARPSVIVNRASMKTGPPHPQETDTTQDVNDYWGFDVAAAMQAYTVPDRSWPEIASERLFECWRCAVFHPSDDFPGSYGKYDDGYRGVNRVVSVLMRMVIGGNMTACQRCVDDVAVRPATTPRKRKNNPEEEYQPLKRAPLPKESAGAWMFEVQVMVIGEWRSCTFHHVGYIVKTFGTKKAAADEYHAANPHMRPIQKESDWTSDWDPVTRRRFIVRKVYNVQRELACPW